MLRPLRAPGAAQGCIGTGTPGSPRSGPVRLCLPYSGSRRRAHLGTGTPGSPRCGRRALCARTPLCARALRSRGLYLGQEPLVPPGAAVGRAPCVPVRLVHGVKAYVRVRVRRVRARAPCRTCVACDVSRRSNPVAQRHASRCALTGTKVQLCIRPPDGPQSFSPPPFLQWPFSQPAKSNSRTLALQPPDRQTARARGAVSAAWSWQKTNGPTTEHLQQPSP